jgi:hypothetical protein
MDPSSRPWRSANAAKQVENQRCPTQQFPQSRRMTKQRTQDQPAHRYGGKPSEWGKLTPEAEHLIKPDQGAGCLGRCFKAFGAPLRDPLPNGELTQCEIG